MISAARVLGLAVAGAALLGMDGVPAPASAQAVCKNERVTAKSEGRIRGEGFATNEAKQRWEKAAEEQFGRSFAKWANAKDTNVECESVKSKRLGMPASLCTAVGRPCSVGGNTTSVEEREGDKKSAKRDDIRDREREREQRRYRTAYDIEMKYQDYLARQRERAEKRAERREAAYWHRLYRRWTNAGYWDWY